MKPPFRMRKVCGKREISDCVRRKVMTSGFVRKVVDEEWFCEKKKGLCEKEDEWGMAALEENELMSG